MDGQLPYDAGNAKQVQAVKRLEMLGQRGDDDAMREVARTEDGRRILYLLAVECGWRGAVWDANSKRQSDFNAGLQQAGINIMGRFARVASAEFMLALHEATRRDTEAEVLRAAVLTPSVTDLEDDNG